MNDFGSLVASTEHEATLETFLDEKLGREKHLAATAPSCISTNDDFAAPPPDPPEEAEDAQAAEGEAQAHTTAVRLVLQLRARRRGRWWLRGIARAWIPLL